MAIFPRGRLLLCLCLLHLLSCSRPLEDSTMQGQDDRAKLLDANKVVIWVVVAVAIGILIQALLVYLSS